VRKISPKQLETLVNWRVSNNAIVKKFSFSSFKEAVLFVNKLAIMAEEHHHHPVINIDYKRVEITLTTKDCGEITEKDLLYTSIML